MRLNTKVFPTLICLTCYAWAQDLSVNNPPYNPNPSEYDPNNPYSNVNNPYGSSTNNPYPSSTNYNPFTPDPNQNRFGQNDPYGGTYGNQDGQYGGGGQYGNQGDLYGNQGGVYGQQPGQYDTNVYGQSSRPPFNKDGGYGGNFYGGPNEFEPFNKIIREATYFVVASRMVRPGQLYRVSVNILQTKQPLVVRASIQRNGVEMSADHKSVIEGIPETLLMRVPTTSAHGEYKLRVEGLYDSVLGGSAFVNETKLTFSQRSMTIFIQLDKPVYMQGEKVRFRAIPINTELKAFDSAVDLYMLDPNGHIMKRWLSRQTNLGIVSLDYLLADQPVFGEWKIRVDAQGQIEENTFLVEEYYQTRFEVNVTMPAFFFTTDQYIHGIVMANYTSGAPVRGNLTIKATVRPIQPIRPKKIVRNRQRDPNYPYIQEQDYEYQYNRGYDRPIMEKYFNFNEQKPFWINYPNYYYDPIPHLDYFYGVYHFRYPMNELLLRAPNLEGLEVVVTATVGERFLNEVIEGYSIARIYNSSLKLSFLGDSPQVFKPGLPASCYMSVSYFDGSPLSVERLRSGRMEVVTSVEMGSGRRDLPITEIAMVPDSSGVWEYNIDLQKGLQLQGPAAHQQLTEISALRIQAYYTDIQGERTHAELLMLTHFSPRSKQIRVSTSTKNAKVGEYIILHIRSNYYVEKFNYLIISKGIVLLTGDEVMDDSVCTMAVTLSAEMAPVATVVVWHIGRNGDVTADSLTFPVNGISRNKFSVFISNRKERTGHEVEVAIYGKPGSYVGLSGIDRAFFTMQAGNELTYAKVLSKMATFDEQTNGTHTRIWSSQEGNPDELIHFPSSTFGIDANRTFEYIGLVVFTDVEVPRRHTFCNASLGYGECLNGRCYRLEKKCDFIMDCEDGTDESGCTRQNLTELSMFRKYRFNRIQRQYENVWVWKDVNIGPHGRYVFTIPVPARPAHWMVSAFSMSQTLGFGMISKPIEYVGVLPFFINVEMPSVCMQGEQVGIRVSVFNYMMNNIEATVVLHGSPDYKFVHVEENGIVRSYNPRTSFGEHQFFIYIKAQDAAVVYVPIVPTRLGDIEVTVHASTLIGRDIITRKLRVEADGLPQHRHHSMLLDLSNRAYAFQYMHVNVTETPIIPYEYDRYYVFGSNKARISVIGDVVGPIFPTMPVNATSLLDLPMDSAEQNMFSFAANMYTTLYMRYTQQRNKTQEKQAFYWMNVGYQRQLSFMQPDGSFSLFRSDWNQSASSVWLTAYCARIFQEASFYEWENFIYIDPGVIAKAVNWVLDHQTPNGSFYETTWSPDRKYNSSLRNPYANPFEEKNITLTAHVLIMLESVKDLTSGLSSRVAIAQTLAISHLEKNIQLLRDFGKPFDIAIVAYALMKSKASVAEEAFNLLVQHSRLGDGLMYWARETIPDPPYKIENQKQFSLPRLPYEYDSENIEATAYALMVYVARQEVLVDYIVRWLNTQRLTDGGWASTSDTANALKALIEYTSAQRIRDISSLSVTVEATSLPGKSQVLYVNDKNRAKLQYIDIPNAWGTVKVQAKGTGFQTMPPVKAFDLRTKAYFYGRNHSHISYVSCQKWTNLNESERSGMAVLDVSIPTGYWIQQQRLDAYILSGRVQNLQRARYFNKKVLFYFDYLDHEETCINFTIERWYPVANMSRFLPIRVYDYYAPERFNETIFDAFTTYLLNICEVCGSSQCPYCYIYNMAATLPVPLITIFASSFLLIVRYLRLQTGVVI